MVRISDPVQIQHPRLQELAWQGAYYAKIAEAIADLEMLCDDLPEQERYEPVPRPGWHEDADALDVALHALVIAYQQGCLLFEDQIAIWLAEDPENWPVLRLVILDPWRDPIARWHPDAPGWLRVLGSCAESAQEKFGEYSRGDVV